LGRIYGSESKLKNGRYLCNKEWKVFVKGNGDERDQRNQYGRKNTIGHVDAYV